MHTGVRYKMIKHISQSDSLVIGERREKKSAFDASDVEICYLPHGMSAWKEKEKNEKRTSMFNEKWTSNETIDTRRKQEFMAFFVCNESVSPSIDAQLKNQVIGRPHAKKSNFTLKFLSSLDIGEFNL